MKYNPQKLFKISSKTFSGSSSFFPSAVKGEVTTLYAFVRTIDNFIDSQPQKKSEFYQFKNLYLKASGGYLSGNSIIDEFVKLEKKKKFRHSWILSFFKSMEMDLKIRKYKTLKDVEKYIYGSAGIVGLCMSKIMFLPPEAYKTAIKLGYSLQYVNFIRDIREDLNLGRMYFPQRELDEFGLKTIQYKETKNKPGAFVKFIIRQIERYGKWQHEAEKGYQYILPKYLIPIKTAADIYKWTAGEIKKDPFIVYRKIVKPSRLRVLLTGLKNYVSIYLTFYSHSKTLNSKNIFFNKNELKNMASNSIEEVFEKFV